MNQFHRAAYRRLVTGPRRARLLVQASYVALADADAIWDPYAWPPVAYDSLPASARADREHLERESEMMFREARALGFRGGKDAAGL